MKRFIIMAVVVMSLFSAVVAGEIGFIEDFALAKDRSASLKSLIPGTEDYYYYHCLQFLHQEQFQKAEEMTRPWLERFGQTPRVLEIQLRHALLTYDRNPQMSVEFLRERLGVHFHHQKEVLGAAPNLPTALDQKQIARETLRAMSLQRWQNLDNFSDHALDWLAGENLNWQRRRHLLQRLTRPDVANLPRLVVDDLNSEHSPGFGAYGIHKQMTLAQLEELVKLKPDLLNQVHFVNAWVSKLRPGDDEDWRNDPKVMQAYLERLWGFVSRLNSAHHSLKAHVLYHRLVLDRTLGVYDQGRFAEYLKLPRHLPYVAQRWLERDEARRYPVDLNANFQQGTLLPVIGSDEALVRSYLKHFLVRADSARAFEPYINDVYLKHLFAEVKIENGLGEPEQWASMLPPELFRALKDRVDIDFAYTNPSRFKVEEPVALDLFVKNVPNLIVKVFEINTTSFYREQKREIDTDINLDGLVPNHEYQFPSNESPFRVMPRRVELPTLNKAGVYVVDFIGAGKSSRALIRKGRLRPLVVMGTSGQNITLIDDANRKVMDAKLWLNGQEYQGNKDGIITVPFSTQPARQPVVLSQGEFSSLDAIDHQAEGYILKAGIHVEREALLTQRVAKVLVRPGLTLNGTPVSITLLEEVKLQIHSVDHDGISTTQEVPNFMLFEDRESIYEFRVPTRLSGLQITLLGKVKSLSQNKSIDLSAQDNFTLNSIDKTDKTEDLHLAKFGADYVIELLGRTGEAKMDRPVQLHFKHRDFNEPIHATLKSDAQGRIMLGALAEIDHVTATGPEGVSHTWDLPDNRHTYRQMVHAKVGEIITLPYLGTAGEPTRAELALFEMRGGVVQSDRFAALGIKDGLIQISGLPAGDYDLWLKEAGRRVHLRIVEGTLEAGHVLGTVRQLKMPGLKPVQIERITPGAEELRIHLRDASRFARVHVFATRYLPEYSAYNGLAEVGDKELGGVYPAQARSSYLTGRNIGDEYRYVLDRKLQKKYPGNMLERPQLLLNPWAVRSTETTEQIAAAGDAFAPKSEAAPSVAAPGAARGGAGGGKGEGMGAGTITSNLDFLADAAAVAVNLVPDKDGVVLLPLKELGPHAWIHVVAVDPLNTTMKSIAVPEKPAQFLDLRLRSGLDPKGHFTQQKQVNMLPIGKPFIVEDIASSRFESFDSLAKIYTLYATLSKDPKLKEFGFILNWPQLKVEEKRKYYSDFACHELSFFLMKKDPEFFTTVIKPYLANKKDKTFLDHWLLENDLSGYLQPWAFGRLNVVERVLLAQRLAGESAKTSRHLNDLWKLLPPNLDRTRMLFDTAIKSGEMGADDTIAKQKELARSALSEADFKARNLGVAAQLRAGTAGIGAPTKDEPVRDSLKMMRAQTRDGATKKDAEKGADKKPEGGERFFAEDRAGKLVRQLYRRLEPTQEWAENNYYKLLIGQQLADLVTVNPLWLDYSQHDGKSPFLSRHLAEGSRNFTEMMFALAVLDLPFTAGKHDIKFDGAKMTFTPASAVIAFHEEVRPAAAAQAKTPILVSQNFYHASDRFREVNGEKVDHFLSVEFLVHTVYGCQVVVTNPTSSRQKLTVLLQLPVGAMPLANGQMTKSILLDLEPYRTQTIDYLFYFPKPGTFTHFPIHVAKNEQYLVSAEPFTFNVVEKPSKIDTLSWDYVSQNGTPEQVLALLNRENIQTLNLEKIAFRMKDKAFFESVMALLRQRHIYHATLWSYSLMHHSVPEMREYLRHADQLVALCGNGPLVSSPLVIEPVARHLYEHLEYKPLVNARTHALGQRRQIVNDRLNQQYHQFLKMLSYKRQLDDADLLAVTYYLLVQDRIDEALETFGRVNKANIATKMQYDYCAAYLAFFSDDPTRARALAAGYANHPVDRWRNAFTAILHQLDEVEGKAGKVVDDKNRTERQGQLAAGEPSFEFTIDAQKMQLTWQNLESVRINYYLMDVELLFSRNPFMQQYGGQFTAIRPNRSQELKLPAGQAKQAVALPADLIKRNVLVEVSAGGKTRSQPYYANTMDVVMQENYGQLKVSESAGGKAISKVYVKVYARLADGQVKFYKDGYTDPRGKFDYASVSTPEKSPIARFAILVLSEEQGALIREAGVPQQ